jgi:hypothetical protein
MEKFVGKLFESILNKRSWGIFSSRIEMVLIKRNFLSQNFIVSSSAQEINIVTSFKIDITFIEFTEAEWALGQTR